MNLEKIKERHNSADKILLVRSSAKQFAPAYEELKRLYPDATVYILSNSDLNGVENLIATPNRGKFYWRDTVWFKKYIEREGLRFDFALILYNSRKGLSYINVDTFAQVASKNNYCIDIDGNLSKLDTSKYLLKMLYRCAGILWLLLNFLFLVLSLAVMFFFMLFVGAINILSKREAG